MDVVAEGKSSVFESFLLNEAARLVRTTPLVSVSLVVGEAFIEVVGAGPERVTVVKIAARVVTRERVTVVVVVMPSVVVEVSMVLKPVGALVIETDVEHDSIQSVVFEATHVATSQGYSIIVNTWQTCCRFCRRNMSGRKLNALATEAHERKGTTKRIFIRECKVGSLIGILYSQVPIPGKRLAILGSKDSKRVTIR